MRNQIKSIFVEFSFNTFDYVLGIFSCFQCILIQLVEICFVLPCSGSTCVESSEPHIAPEHAEAQVGDGVQLNCTTYYKTEPVNWQHIPHGKNLTLDVYIGGQFVNNYDTTRYKAQTNNKTGTNNLIITAVKLGDSGLYRCIEQEGRGQHSDAELSVIGI